MFYPLYSGMLLYLGQRTISDDTALLIPAITVRCCCSCTSSWL